MGRKKINSIYCTMQGPYFIWLTITCHMRQ